MAQVVFPVADEEQYASRWLPPVAWFHAFLAGHGQGVVKRRPAADSDPNIRALQLFLRQPWSRLCGSVKLEEKYAILWAANSRIYK